MDKKYTTNYAVAANWLHSSLILCNEIIEVDESVLYNQRFSSFTNEDDEDCDEENEEAYEREIFQWYLTDCSQSDVEYLEEHFGLLFTYSDKLDLYVLCVDHFGTRWSYVECDTDLEQAVCKLGETK